MTDVFLSYSSKDREAAKPVRDAIEAAGYSVFWDQQVPVGRDWNSWIGDRLRASRLVVVLWSKASVVSRNVIHEATIANEAGKLLPVQIARLRPDEFPMGFYTVQAADLTDFAGDRQHAELVRLIASLNDRLGSRKPVTSSSSKTAISVGSQAKFGDSPKQLGNEAATGGTATASPRDASLGAQTLRTSIPKKGAVGFPRIAIVAALGIIALGSAAVWALGQFGDSLNGAASASSEPVTLEIAAAANEPPAAPAATPVPSKPATAAKPAASKPAASKPEPAKSQPAPAAMKETRAAETQASPPPPPAPEAAPAGPAKPNPLKPNALDSSKPADALSQLLPGAKPAAPSAPAADAPAASAPMASTPATPAAPPPATATAQAAPAQSAPGKAADPIVKPQQVDAPATANAAVAAATGVQAQLKSRAITYNKPPQKLALNKVVDVTLVINATEDADAGKEALQGAKGEVVERNVDLSDNVAAQLTALNGGFKITPLTIERQKLSGKILNRWQWSVEPTEIGTHTLVLDIFGFASGSLDAEQLANYQDKITVEVQQLDQVIGWAKGVQPLFAVLAALAGITSASVAFLRFRDERKAKKTAKSN